jgi:hypothetical protein
MVVLAAILPAASASADTLSVEPQPPKISAFDGTAAWSTYENGAWHLVARRTGVLERLPVAPRSVPFDVDVGTDASGRMVATYSRCRREPPFVPPQGRGCDLYAYDFFSRTERLLRGPSTDTASEYMPSMEGGRIAFGRVRNARTDVYVGARRVPGGTRNGDERTGLTGLDLRATHLAIAWRTFGPAGLPFPYGTAELRVNDLRTGAQTIVVRLVNSNLDTGSVVTPALLGRGVRYGMSWVSEGDTEISAEQAYDVRQGMRTSLTLPDGLAGVAENGSGETYFVRCDPDGGPCEVNVIWTPPLGTDPDVHLTRLELPTPLASSGRWVAYSGYDRAARVYRLTLRSSEGRVLRPDVRPRRVPFDVDLGRGPRDELTAVYSRCRTEPRRNGEGMPIPSTGRGCEVYRYDTRSGRERKVPGASGFLPAVDGSRIVFARRAGRGSTELATASGRLTTLRGRPMAIDLHGRRVALAVDRGLRSQVLLAGPDGHARALATVTSRNGMRRLRAVAFNGDVLSWVGYHVPGLGPRAAIRRDLDTGAQRVFVLPDRATAYVPWIVRHNVPQPHVGVYGRTDSAGWALSAALMLPELLRP